MEFQGKWAEHLRGDGFWKLQFFDFSHNFSKFFEIFRKKSKKIWRPKNLKKKWKRKYVKCDLDAQRVKISTVLRSGVSIMERRPHLCLMNMCSCVVFARCAKACAQCITIFAKLVLALKMGEKQYFIILQPNQVFQKFWANSFCREVVFVRFFQEFGEKSLRISQK